jgi:hypothetical protein
MRIIIITAKLKSILNKKVMNSSEIIILFFLASTQGHQSNNNNLSSVADSHNVLNVKESLNKHKCLYYEI